jgi:hypothetical protein
MPTPIENLSVIINTTLNTTLNTNEVKSEMGIAEIIFLVCIGVPVCGFICVCCNDLCCSLRNSISVSITTKKNTVHKNYGLDNSTILKMNLENSNKEKENSCNHCSICLEDLKSKKVILNCGHSYHIDCINTWIQSQYNKDIVSKCPLCRQTIIEIPS